MAWFLLVIAVLFLIAVTYAAMNSLRKQELLEDFVEGMQIDLKKVLLEMKRLDDKQMFEKDDEVGVLFTMMKAIISKLDAFLGPADDQTE